MRKILALAVLVFCAPVRADDRVFVTNVGFQSSRVTSVGNTTTVVQTGLADSHCANGVCFAPVVQANQYGYHRAAAVAVPQSTYFFAASNPRVFEFRTREFIQVPGTQQIVTTDAFGNEVILNAGIRTGGVGVSRGTQLFAR